MSGNSVKAGGLALEFDNIEFLDISEYPFAGGFNKLERAWKVSYGFTEPCEIHIQPFPG
jgi:hypothetical protein